MKKVVLKKPETIPVINADECGSNKFYLAYHNKHWCILIAGGTYSTPKLQPIDINGLSSSDSYSLDGVNRTVSEFIAKLFSYNKDYIIYQFDTWVELCQYCIDNNIGK